MGAEPCQAERSHRAGLQCIAQHPSKFYNHAKCAPFSSATSGSGVLMSLSYREACSAQALVRAMRIGHCHRHRALPDVASRDLFNLSLFFVFFSFFVLFVFLRSSGFGQDKRLAGSCGSARLVAKAATISMKVIFVFAAASM